jgi:signal transduction histidine kinase/CheY-like chemotaxis protein
MTGPATTHAGTASLGRLGTWLRDIPVEDPLERRNAPALQVLLFLLGIVPLVAWLILSEPGASGPSRFDLPALSATALIALVVMRRGHLHGAVGLVLAGFMATLGASLLAEGLEAERALLPAALVPLAFASQLVRRRGLWVLLAAVIGLPIAAALRDVPAVWPDAGTALNPVRNTVLSSFVLSALFLTVILDRLTKAQRVAYAQWVEQAERLALANTRLRSVESRFRAAVEGSLDAFLLLDAVRGPDSAILDFTVRDLNERAARLYGYPREVLIGERLSVFRPQAFFDGGSFTTWARVADGRETVEEEFTPLAPLAGATWLRQQVVPVGDGVAVMLRDLTTLRAAEAAASDLRAQFLQSQKMEVVGVLAGSVAHDFNNLLTVIGGHAELLLQDGLEPDSREGVEQILYATERAVDLTRSLLAFSRKRGTSPRVIRLGSVLQRSRTMWQRLVGFPITLSLELDDDLPVRLDEGEFDQIMLNLLVNARDAMPEGGQITLRLRSTVIDLPGDDPSDGRLHRSWVVLEVADTGTGMDQETMSHLFEPFYTTKPAGQGTGLGLPTVRRLITEQGGRVTAESHPGAGSTFRLYWPRADAPPDDETTAVATARAPGSETILFLDDDPGVGRLFESSLSAMGYRVLVARSGEEAMALAERGSIDLLVADIELPDAHGAEVAARLRQRQKDLPVIFFTGSTEAILTIEPAQRLLHKPVTPRELARQIRSVLDEAAADVGRET